MTCMVCNLNVHRVQKVRPNKRNELSTTRDRNLILKGENPSLNNHRNRRNRFRPSDRTLYELGYIKDPILKWM